MVLKKKIKYSGTHVTSSLFWLEQNGLVTHVPSPSVSFVACLGTPSYTNQRGFPALVCDAR